jgi:hypothetical protein
MQTKCYAGFKRNKKQFRILFWNLADLRLEPCRPSISKVGPSISLSLRYRRCNLRYRRSKNDLRYRVRCVNSISNVLTVNLTFDIQRFKSDKRRYRRLQYTILNQYDIEESSILKPGTSKSTQYDIEETSISKSGNSISMQHNIEEKSISKFKTSISLYTDIEDFSVSINDPSISVYYIEALCYDFEFCVL